MILRYLPYNLEKSRPIMTLATLPFKHRETL
jgi:hypothetical protein